MLDITGNIMATIDISINVTGSSANVTTNNTNINNNTNTNNNNNNNNNGGGGVGGGGGGGGGNNNNNNNGRSLDGNSFVDAVASYILGDEQKTGITESLVLPLVTNDDERRKMNQKRRRERRDKERLDKGITGSEKNGYLSEGISVIRNWREDEGITRTPPLYIRHLEEEEGLQENQDDDFSHNGDGKDRASDEKYIKWVDEYENDVEEEDEEEERTEEEDSEDEEKDEKRGKPENLTRHAEENEDKYIRWTDDDRYMTGESRDTIENGDAPDRRRTAMPSVPLENFVDVHSQLIRRQGRVSRRAFSVGYLQAWFEAVLDIYRALQRSDGAN